MSYKNILSISKTSDKIWFTASQNLTEEQAMEAQLEYGKHPAGYGFYGYERFVPSNMVVGNHVRWWCSTSCD